jgi:DNA polymerase-3 subunit epsilon
LGGIPRKGISKKTDFLVVGDTSYYGVTSKQEKAMALQVDGSDIQIITESIFLNMVSSI